MKMIETGLSYRRVAIAGASTIGLMIALFDTLVGDLRRAAAALRKSDIEIRCREMNHAALVISQLESWVDLKNGGESAQTLSRFYAYLRAKMLEAAGAKSASLLERQIEMILHIRSAWQQLDASPPQPTEGMVRTTLLPAYDSVQLGAEPTSERVPFSQSA
jgi:flagellar protein FliS